MFQQEPYDVFSTHALPPAVRRILLITIAVTCVQFLIDEVTGTPRTHGKATEYFSLSIDGIASGRLWGLVTYMFLHGGFWHIFLNMLVLFFLGPETERTIGSRNFIVLYLWCGILGGIGWLLVSLVQGVGATALCFGASGAIYGVLGAFAGLFPRRPITLLLFFVLPITMTARTLAAGLAFVTFAAMVLSNPAAAGGVAHAAHLTGGLVGYVCARTLFRDAYLGIVPDMAGWFSTVRAKVRRSRLRVLDETPDDEQASPEEVDRILDKIIDHGIHSLSRREKDTLEQASRDGTDWPRRPRTFD
jgi:membrane associated rhomboid family serine protease